MLIHTSCIDAIGKSQVIISHCQVVRSRVCKCRNVLNWMVDRPSAVAIFSATWRAGEFSGCALCFFFGFFSLDLSVWMYSSWDFFIFGFIHLCISLEVIHCWRAVSNFAEMHLPRSLTLSTFPIGDLLLCRVSEVRHVEILKVSRF